MANKKFLHLLFPTLAATLLGLTVSLAASSQSGRPARPVTRAATEVASTPPAPSGASGASKADVAADWPPPVKPTPPTACAGRLTGSHATYDVGPGQRFTELTDVPWLDLQAGDVVNVHYRSEPYRTKFGLRAQGTANAPVIINGVTSETCLRPVISGDKAVTARDARMAQFGKVIEDAGIILIYKLPTDDRETYTPRHIVIQNLKLTGAKIGNRFVNMAGDEQTYSRFSAAIYAVRVHDLTVENCEITGNGLGVFTNTKGDTPQEYSANVIIRRNLLYQNGNLGSYTEHNLYVQARRALYEGNFIGQAFGGSSLKDRSSGTVIRYNKILASARALDLVETEEEQFKVLQQDPLYPYAWVYGNLIINDSSAPIGFAVNVIHWGFDNSIERGRNGVLFFYHNTLVSRVAQKAFWYVVPFQIGRDGLAPPGATVEAASNVFWQQSDNEWRFLSQAGTLKFVGTNHVPPNWYPSKPGSAADVQTKGARMMAGQDPKLDTNGLPLAGSPVLNQPDAGPSFTPPGAIAENLRVEHQYKTGVGIVPRPPSGKPGRTALGAMAGP
ncbi:MAG: right-handed parallel beta-helix repeat-containing protein [Aquabacterium sp.]|nr:right-handed parallel beta-helix repeat-containing protein [Aquabacterium sp.]